jgi:hypothetical protein
LNLACVLLPLFQQPQIQRFEAMLEFIRKRKPAPNAEVPQGERSSVIDENEYLVMSCGAFNPRFLAKIKRSMEEKKRQ